MGVAVAGGVAVGLGVAEGVGVGVGLAGGVGVGVTTPPLGAWISTVIGEPVLKKPTVALTSVAAGWHQTGNCTSCPANRIRVLIGANVSVLQVIRACVLSNIPWRAAESGISLCAIMRPARMLRRRVKSDVSYVNSGGQGHTERLDGAVQVHIKEGILIVPDAAEGWVTL